MDDKKDFDRLFRLYYDELFRFAHRMVGDVESCHDIVSDAYEGLWKHYADIEAATVRAYLYQTVRNGCIDCLERQRKGNAYAEAYRKVTSWVDDSDALAERDEQVHAMRHVLGLMDDKTRTILKRCYVERKKYKEVAEEFGISTSTVKKYMIRALKIINENKLKKA